MIKLDVCIEDSCHLKGSKHVFKTFKELIDKNKLEDKIYLSGAFCLGNCVAGVSVSINDNEVFSVTPETAEEFFINEVMGRI